MKKTLAFTLVLALVLSLCCMGVAAADVTVTTLADLQNAIANAGAGDTIILGNDIDAGATRITIPDGTDITLDLNGNTLSGSSAQASNFELIDVLGALTVKDGTNTDGKIEFTYTGASSAWGWYSNTISVRGGSLTLESGSIINATPSCPQHIFFAVDVNSTLDDTYFYINGGSVECENYRAIRQFANSTTKENAVIMTTGSVVGAIWTNDPTNDGKSAKAELKISGGSVEKNNYADRAIYVDYENGSNADIANLDVEVSAGDVDGTVLSELGASGTVDPFVSGGTFTDESVKDYIADDKVAMVAAGDDGRLKVGDESEAGAIILDDNGEEVYYESIDDAFDNSDEVYINPLMLEDGDTIVVPDGKTGYIISDDGNHEELEEGEYTVTSGGGGMEPVVNPTNPAPTPTPTPTPSTPPTSRPNPSTGVKF